MPIPFEATRSYVYKASRYELLPRIVEAAKDFKDVPFRLRDIWRPMLAETYTPEQLEMRVPKLKNPDVTERMSTIFGFYIPGLAENLKFFENLGEGMFRNISLDEEIAEADAAATDTDTDTDADTNGTGTIYAYSFPSIRTGGKFPIKIGKTVTGDADARVAQQCKQTCCFEHPVVLKIWEVQRVAAVEIAIHRTLEARGSKRQAPGNEWFNTTLEEVESIVNFVRPMDTEKTKPSPG